ncbi:MAG: DNA-3-methyladenine glycosylase 2 family protein [Christensenellaceae bacterium]|nr:DNA-3-methyladenine glycosylase 2 family protein [Christensenellaceae bacterium]
MEFRLKGRIDLEATLFSGQSFVWERAENGFSTEILGGARARQLGDGICLEIADEARLPAWREYFDLDADYGERLAPVMDAPLAAAIAHCPGLRMLRQPFYSTLCGFILSSNNNIPRIMGLMRKLEGLATKEGFPMPEEILAAGEERLRQMGMGYRARYIHGSARLMAGGFNWQALRDMDYESAKKALMTLPGVGGKVADCVLLFAVGHSQAFPVDVWMERALKGWYGLSGSPEALRRQAVERFGAQAGLAQNFLFHYARTGPEFRRGASPGAAV